MIGDWELGLRISIWDGIEDWGFGFGIGYWDWILGIGIGDWDWGLGIEMEDRIGTGD